MVKLGKENRGAARTNQSSELQLQESWVAMRLDEDRPEDVHVLVLAGLDILVEEVHSPPCPRKSGFITKCGNNAKKGEATPRSIGKAE
jgi:hypothetical protein